MDNIRKELTDELIWVSIDETRDAAGRYVVNIVVGSLKTCVIILLHNFCEHI